MAYIECGINGCCQAHDPKYDPVIKALQNKGEDISSTACPAHVSGALHLYRSKEEDRKRKEANDMGRQLSSDNVDKRGKLPDPTVPQKLNDEAVTKTKASEFLKLLGSEIDELLEVGLLENDPWGTTSQYQYRLVSSESIYDLIKKLLYDPELTGKEFLGLNNRTRKKLSIRAVHIYPRYLVGGVLD